MRKPTRLEFAARAARAVFLLVALAALYAVLSGCSAAAAAGVPIELRSTLGEIPARYERRGLDDFDPREGYVLLGHVYDTVGVRGVETVGPWAMRKRAQQKYGAAFDLIVFERIGEPLVGFDGHSYALRIMLEGRVYRRSSRCE